MRTIDDLVLFFLTLLVAFSIGFSGCEAVIQEGGVALAQDRERAIEERALLRICAHESTTFSLDDCAGIYSVIRHAMETRGLSFLAAARDESPRFFGGEPGDMNAWTAVLELDCARPEGIRASWTAAVVGWDGQSRQDRCVTLAARVHELVGGPAVCEATAWGSRSDYAARHAQGCTWVPVDCGDTRNRFSQALRCPAPRR